MAKQQGSGRRRRETNVEREQRQIKEGKEKRRAKDQSLVGAWPGD